MEHHVIFIILFMISTPSALPLSVVVVDNTPPLFMVVCVLSNHSIGQVTLAKDTLDLN